MKKWSLLGLGTLIGIVCGKLASISPAHACDCDFEDYLELVAVDAEGDEAQVDFWMASPRVTAVHAVSGLHLDKGPQVVRLELSP